MSPRVSVVMAVYNGVEFLGEAIESILSQTFSDFEFLIIDDGSKGTTPVLLSEYTRRDVRIQIHRFADNRGLATALNYGIRQASGEYIARMDADDLSLPERLGVQVTFMDAHPEVGICGTWVELIGDTERQVWEYPRHHAGISAQMLFSNALAHPSVMMRAWVLNQHNLKYDESVRHAQDYELWSRAISRTELANIPHILVQHRRHAQSTGDQYHHEQLQTHEIVVRRLLAPFGLGDSAEEVRLHCRLGAHQYGSDTQFLRQAREWLERLMMANRKLRLIPPEALNVELGRYWTLVCLRSGAHPATVLAYIVFPRLPFRGKTGFPKIIAGLQMFFARLLTYVKRLINDDWHAWKQNLEKFLGFVLVNFFCFCHFWLTKLL